MTVRKTRQPGKDGPGDALGEKEAAVRDAILLLLKKVAYLSHEEWKYYGQVWSMRDSIERKLNSRRPRVTYRIELLVQWESRSIGSRAMLPTLILHADNREMLFMYGFVVEPTVHANDHHIVVTWEVGRGGDARVRDDADRYAEVAEYTPLAEAVRLLDFERGGVSISVSGGIKGETPIQFNATFKKPVFSLADYSRGEAGRIEALLRDVDEEKGMRQRLLRLPAPKFCDLCRCSFGREVYLVDGAIDSGLFWGDMCLRCTAERGSGIGWGKGQLYKRQEDGSWLCVAGFPPEEGDFPLEDFGGAKPPDGID